jgi:hypothetical protein
MAGVSFREDILGDKVCWDSTLVLLIGWCVFAIVFYFLSDLFRVLILVYCQLKQR